LRVIKIQVLVPVKLLLRRRVRILRYRGYSIEDLADKADFLEVSFLLVFGELPTAVQLKQFEDDIRNTH
jgi:citrate synthase